MNVDSPIITSLLDNDLYTFTVGQVAFKLYPTANVQYVFINRGGTPFPENFDIELKKQLEFMRNIKLTDEERAYLENLGYFSKEYLDFLSNYRFNPDHLGICNDNGDIGVLFSGTWVDEIMWEVPFLALVSELYYKMTGATKDSEWKIRIHKKAHNLSSSGCKWMEFGTRRRFDFEAQNEVVAIMKNYAGFLGTSNVLLAMQHRVPVLGTMSHQGPMAMQALVGATKSNKAWREAWLKVYPDKLLTFLPDTLTTDVFLRDFTKDEAILWNLRQDSGSPDAWLERILKFYADMGIDSKTKTAVLSDSLNDDSFKDYTLRYRDRINIIGGIGTFFSNDCGHKPLSIVIKLSTANFGNGTVSVVKLSDTNGKYTGLKVVINEVKAELGIQ